MKCNKCSAKMEYIGAKKVNYGYVDLYQCPKCYNLVESNSTDKGLLMLVICICVAVVVCIALFWEVL